MESTNDQGKPNLGGPFELYVLLALVGALMAFSLGGLLGFLAVVAVLVAAILVFARPRKMEETED